MESISIREIKVSRLTASWFGRALLSLLFLNIIDASATLLWVAGGYAEELNPLLREWISISPLAFVMFKVFLVSAGALLLWRLRSSWLAHFLLWPALAVYIFVVGIHCMIGYRLAEKFFFTIL